MMQTYSEETIKEIEQLAGLFYTPKEIKVMLGLTNEFEKECKVEDSVAYNAYWKGWFASEMVHRKKILETAKLGSTPAQSMIETIIAASRKKMINR